MMDIAEIWKMIPHRYPFLLVDRILEIETGTKAIAIKNVTINEPFFTGHFPGNPVMPGVLLVEGMAQVAGVIAFHYGASGNTVYFLSIERAKFRKPVVPGDQVKFEITVTQRRGNVWKFSGKAEVEGKLVAEAEFTAMTLNKEI